MFSLQVLLILTMFAARVCLCYWQNGLSSSLGFAFHVFFLFLGMDHGAGLLDLETRGLSWLCRSKSDILSQKFVHSVII